MNKAYPHTKAEKTTPKQSRIPAQLRHHHWRGDGDIDSVDVIDQGEEEEEEQNGVAGRPAHDDVVLFALLPAGGRGAGGG